MLECRPAGAFASAFYISACVLFSVGYSLRTFFVIAALAAVILCAVFFKRLSFKRGACAIAAGAFTASMFSCAVLDIRIPKMVNTSGDVLVEGTVTDVAYRASWGGIYTVDTENGRISLTCDNGELSVGDVIRCDAEFCDGDEEYIIYARADGIYVFAEAVGKAEVISYDCSIAVFAAKLRNTLSARLGSEMSAMSGGFVSSLLLGDRSSLADSIRRDFRTLGISHVLALSGTHLTLLFRGIGSLMSDKRRILKAVVLCPLVLLYMLLTGLSASVTRAGIMFIIGTAGSAINKKTDSFTSLSVSVLTICIFDWSAPFDVGLQLSYVSVLGLIMSSELKCAVISDKRTAVRRIVMKIIPPIVVPSVLLPLMWLSFGSVSLVSPIANIILVPAASAFIPASAVLLILSVIPRLFVPLSHAVDGLISVFLRVTEYSAQAVGSSFYLVGKVTAVVILLFTVSVILAVLFEGKLRRAAVSLSCIFMCVTFTVSQCYLNDFNNGVTMCFSSCKKDEAVCVVTDGYNILVDMSMYSSALRSAAEIGVKYGSDRIDALFITKPYNSHRASVAYIAENYYLESLWLPEIAGGKDAIVTEALEKEAEDMGICVYTYLPGEVLNFGNCEFTSPKVAASRETEFSLVYEGRSVSYSGYGCVEDSDVNILGIGKAKNKDLLDSSGITVLSQSNAALYKSVFADAYVTDLGIIRIPRRGEITVDSQSGLR